VRKALTYEQYLTSDVWRCSNSPTGAHHWVEIQHAVGEDFHTGLWYCKYCMDGKKFPKDWAACNKMVGVIKEGQDDDLAS